MSIFELKEMENITGPIRFYALVRNGKCEFDDFMNEIERDGNLRKEIRKLYHIMQVVSEGHNKLPETKFRRLSTSVRETSPEFEFKTSKLRAYGIPLPGNIVVICAGKKTTQDKDISHFRSVKKEYLAQL